MPKTLQEIADFVHGTVAGDPQILIHGVAGIKEAQPGEITFLANSRYASFLPFCRASAVIISPESPGEIPLPSIRAGNPYLALAQVLHLFYDVPHTPTGIHPQAVLDPSVSVGEDASIHPFAVIGKEVRIGSRVQIYSGASIGDFCQIGDETVIYPNVILYPRCLIGCRVHIHAGAVIGSDGFGYVWDGKEHYKIPQIGGVIIEDDVEIGAGTTIDRGTMNQTIIRQGTKIDNLVQIAHNVVVGERSIIVSQVGIAGSAEIGKRVTLGGQVGVAGHIKVGDQTMVAAKSGVSKNVPPQSIIAGGIAKPIQEWRKSEVFIRRLPELHEQIRLLKERIKNLEDKLSSKG